MANISLDSSYISIPNCGTEEFSCPKASTCPDPQHIIQEIEIKELIQFELKNCFFRFFCQNSNSYINCTLISN
jgi:hypothetical protein